MKTVRLTRLFACVVFFASLIGCQRTDLVLQTPASPKHLSDDIQIGVVGSVTGDLGQTAFGPGASVMLNAFNLALEEVNRSGLLGDARLSFIIEDDNSTIAGAETAYNKLIHEDKVPVILGVWTSHIARSVFPIAQENSVVALSPVVTASGLTEIGDFIFRTSLPAEVLISHGIEESHSRLGYQRVATIADTVDYASQVSNEVFRQKLSTKGVDVLANETFVTGDTDFWAQLARIKGLNPDAIFISAQDIELVQILRQARESGIPYFVPFITLILSEDLIQSAGAAAEGTITFSGWSQTSNTPGNQLFIENYEVQFGMRPSHWTAQSYASVFILAHAIKMAESTDAAAIADALAQLENFDTILGPFSFDAHGNGLYEPVVLIVRDGALHNISDISDILPRLEDEVTPIFPE